MTRVPAAVCGAEGLDPQLLFLYSKVAGATKGRVQILQELHTMTVVLILFVKARRPRTIELLEIVKHDGYREVKEEIAANDDHHHKENGGEHDTVTVLHHLHYAEPAFEGRTLENGEIAAEYIVKVRYSEVELFEDAVSIEVLLEIFI